MAWNTVIMVNENEALNDLFNFSDITEIASFEDMCPKCKSENIQFKCYTNRDRHDRPQFECKNCRLLFTCVWCENKCPREKCKSSNVEFKYYNNTRNHSKFDQPRFKCNECGRLFARFPQRRRHLGGYKKETVKVEPPQHVEKMKVCPSCGTSSETTQHKFYNCNNNDTEQPRYKCGNPQCKQLFSLKKGRSSQSQKNLISDGTNDDVRSSNTTNLQLYNIFGLSHGSPEASSSSRPSMIQQEQGQQSIVPSTCAVVQSQIYEDECNENDLYNGGYVPSTSMDLLQNQYEDQYNENDSCNGGFDTNENYHEGTLEEELQPCWVSFFPLRPL